MSGTRRFVHILDDVAELDALRHKGTGPVLVYGLDGFLDAGHAGKLLIDHLLDADPGKVVASFDLDSFYDYRARRPAMTFTEYRYGDYEAPRLVVRLCHDSIGAPFLLLHGPEPDTHWEAFASAVLDVIEHFSVRLAVSVGAVPMAVPHTRPMMVTTHATRAELMTGTNLWRGDLRIPASAASLLELRLGEWGHDAMGFVAHVPHYLGGTDYPTASVRLLEHVEVVSGLTWDFNGLHEAAERTAKSIEEQVADSTEIADVVRGLEQQYDAFHTGDAALPMAQAQELPTAEELGAEFERFLAGLDPEE